MAGIRASVLTSAAALLLAACGGGGGGSPNAVGVNFSWSQMAGNDGNTVGTGVATFTDGSIVGIGAYDGNAVFARGTPQQVTLVPGSAPGLYLARYDRTGRLSWAKRAVGQGTVQGVGVTTHADGTFTVTGFFNGTATFGEGDPAMTTLTTSGFEDVFVAHYSGAGALQWVRQAEGALGYEEATRVAVRSDGSVAITGLYTADVTFGTGEPHQTTLPTSGSGVDGFLACYAIDGSLRWATSFKASGGASGWGVAAVSDGGFAIAGSYAGSAVFGEGEAFETDLTGVGTSLDAFTARYDMNGNLLWARSAGNAGDDAAYGVAVVPGDLVRVTGVFGGDAVFGSEGPSPVTLTGFGDTTDDFLAGYDDLGNLEWAKAFGSTGYDFATSIAAYGDGTCAVTGTFAGDATFGQGEAGQTLASSAGTDDHEVFVARFQPDGSLDWVAVTKGVHGSDNEGAALASSADGTCVVTGYFVDNIEFGTGLFLSGHSGASLGGVGDHDAFIARYNPNGGF